MEHHSPLLRKFITLGRVTAEQVKARQNEANTTAELICLSSGMSSKELAQECLDLFKVPYFDLEQFNVAEIPKELVKEKLIRKHHILPLVKKGRKILLPPQIPPTLAPLRTLSLALVCNVKCWLPIISYLRKKSTNSSMPQEACLFQKLNLKSFLIWILRKSPSHKHKTKKKTRPHYCLYQQDFNGCH